MIPMKTKILSAIVVLLTGGIVAQAQSNPPAKKEGTRTAKSAASAVPASDVAAIRAESRAYVTYSLARDWPNWGKLFKDDAIIQPAHATLQTGLAEIGASLKTIPLRRDWRVDPLEIGGHGDFAYVRGEWSHVLTPANQPEQPEAGKYIQIWRKQSDGSWKFVRDIWNWDLPVK